MFPRFAWEREGVLRSAGISATVDGSQGTGLCRLASGRDPLAKETAMVTAASRSWLLRFMVAGFILAAALVIHRSRNRRKNYAAFPICCDGSNRRA